MEKTSDQLPLVPSDYSERLAETWEMLLGIGQATAAASTQRRKPEHRTSFTLISGFLGSGKTTLLNALLSQPHGVRLAVLVNDFGAINIDAALLQSRDANTISLSNGCVCCSIANGLAKTIVDLLEGDVPPQAIVLESSGVAEPHGVIQIALSNPALNLSGIVTVIDTDSVLANIVDPLIRPTIERQAAAADLVLLNKADLATTRTLDEVRKLIAGKAPNARILETSFGNVPIAVVLGSFGTRLGFHVDDVTDYHRNAFESSAFTLLGLIDEAKLCKFAETLPAGVLRAKGLISLANDRDHSAVLQVVGTRWNIEKGPRQVQPARSDLVVIGLAGQFDADDLGRRFDDCLST